MGKVDKQIISLLESSEKPLSLVEIADLIGKPSKTIFKSLRKLFQKGEVDFDPRSRQYSRAKK